MAQTTVEREEAAWSGGELVEDPHANPQKAEKVRRMFAAIAGSYDLNNRLHSFGRDVAWRKVAVKMAAPKPTDVVLDAACGTGDLALAFRRAGAGRVIGVDFTREMLDVARRREPEDVEWIEADAQRLPFEDASVDIVSIAFGIRNVTDPEAALREFRRVLRPGGRLVILEFARPRFAPIAWMNDLYCKRIMPWTATLISGDRSGAYRYLPKSVETFLTPERLRGAMERSGFGEIRTRALTFGVCVCYRGVAV